MRVQIQSEASECGLACLAMVAEAYGQSCSVKDLRRIFSTGLKGANFGQLSLYASRMGLSARGVKLEMNELRELKLPCLLHWDLNHVVLLVGVRRNAVCIIDPAVGARRLSTKDAARHFTGIALELTPTVEFKAARHAPRLNFGALAGSV